MFSYQLMIMMYARWEIMLHKHDETLFFWLNKHLYIIMMSEDKISYMLLNTHLYIMQVQDSYIHCPSIKKKVGRFTKYLKTFHHWTGTLRNSTVGSTCYTLLHRQRDKLVRFLRILTVYQFEIKIKILVQDCMIIRSMPQFVNAPNSVIEMDKSENNDNLLSQKII